jgi:hypothetical protein
MWCDEILLFGMKGRENMIGFPPPPLLRNLVVIRVGHDGLRKANPPSVVKFHIVL